MEGKKPASGDKYSGPKDAASSAAEPSKIRTWGEDRVSAAELFERLNQIPVNQVQPPVHRDLSSSEFLEYLKNQGPEGQYRRARTMSTDSSSQGSSSRGQSMHYKDRNQDCQSVAIDQCDITSSVDYGSRDYYRPSTNASENPNVFKENELDEVHNSSVDTRGNWWQGSLYY